MLKNADYFGTYGKHLASGCTPRQAWKKTEQDLAKFTGGYNRYSTYQSFQVAFTRYKKGELNRHLLLKLKTP
jgi:hypothetical protein